MKKVQEYAPVLDANDVYLWRNICQFTVIGTRKTGLDPIIFRFVASIEKL